MRLTRIGVALRTDFEDSSANKHDSVIPWRKSAEFALAYGFNGFSLAAKLPQALKRFIVKNRH